MRKARVITIPENRIMVEEEVNKLLDHAYKSSVWYITTYDRNSYQTKEKLLKKGYLDENITVQKDNGGTYSLNMVDYTIDKLKNYLILDDEKYVESFIESSLRQGKSVSTMRTKLKQNGMPVALIDTKIDELCSDSAEEDGIVKVAEKIMRTSSFMKLDEYKQKEKLIRSLASKGYSLDKVYEWINNNFSS